MRRNLAEPAHQQPNSLAAVGLHVKLAGNHKLLHPRLDGSSSKEGFNVPLLSDRDFADSGLSISEAMVEARVAYSGDLKERTDALAILWGGEPVVVGDLMPVPQHGMVKVELLSKSSEARQAMDIDIREGSVALPDGSHARLLRTWFDEGLSDTVQYPYEASNGFLRTCNAYEIVRGGEIYDERWTNNAGMRVIQDGNSRIYHCNHGLTAPATFTDLVYRLTVSPV